MWTQISHKFLSSRIMETEKKKTKKEEEQIRATKKEEEKKNIYYRIPLEYTKIRMKY